MDLAEANRTRVETLFIDLELAATFAAVAESSVGQRRERNLANARLAYLTIKDTLLRLCAPTESGTRTNTAVIARLRAAVAEAKQ